MLDAVEFMDRVECRAAREHTYNFDRWLVEFRVCDGKADIVVLLVGLTEVRAHDRNAHTIPVDG